MSIKKITVEIGGKEIVLSMDEARKLFLDLSELFPRPVPIWSYTCPEYPIPGSAADVPLKPPIVTCSAGEMQ